MNKLTRLNGIRGLLISGLMTASAQAARFDNITVNELTTPSSASIVQQIGAVEDDSYWLAYEVKAQPGVRSPCCWRGDWRKSGQDWSNREQQCNLDTRMNGFGSHHDSPLSEHITVLARIESGQPTRLMTVGDTCPVTGPESTVYHAGMVTAATSNDWLENLVTGSETPDRVGDQALAGIAMTAGDGADALLLDFASENNRDYSSEAIFWMGELRQDAGVDGLLTLYGQLPAGKIRQSINFALSVNGSKRAIDHLVNIATSDDNSRQRGDALFWLSQSDAEDEHGLEVHRLLRQAIDSDPSKQVGEQALHGLSELETDAAAETLIDVTRHHHSTETRATAMFWLAQAYPEQAEQEILAQMSSLESRKMIEQAVFALSQLPDGQSTDALFKLIHGEYPKATKRQALFWLAQSDDPRAISQVESLLQQ